MYGQVQLALQGMAVCMTIKPCNAAWLRTFTQECRCVMHLGWRHVGFSHFQGNYLRFDHPTDPACNVGSITPVMMHLCWLAGILETLALHGLQGETRCTNSATTQ